MISAHLPMKARGHARCMVGENVWQEGDHIYSVYRRAPHPYILTHIRAKRDDASFSFLFFCRSLTHAHTQTQMHSHIFLFSVFRLERSTFSCLSCFHLSLSCAAAAAFIYLFFYLFIHLFIHSFIWRQKSPAISLCKAHERSPSVKCQKVFCNLLTLGWGFDVFNCLLVFRVGLYFVQKRF